MGQVIMEQPAISLFPIEIDPNKKYLIQVKIGSEYITPSYIEDVVTSMCSELIALGCKPGSVKIVITPAGVDILASEQ